MKTITMEQRAAIVRKAIAERDAILAGTPIISADAALERIREAIASDRCNGDSEYARGINAACENHLKLIDAITASIWQSEVQAVDQTPPDAHGTEPEQETAGALIEDAGDFMRTITAGDLREQARRQSEKGNHTNAERLWDAAKDAEGKGKWFISEKVACRREAGCQSPSHCERSEVCGHG